MAAYATRPPIGRAFGPAGVRVTAMSEERQEEPHTGCPAFVSTSAGLRLGCDLPRGHAGRLHYDERSGVSWCPGRR